MRLSSATERCAGKAALALFAVVLAGPTVAGNPRLRDLYGAAAVLSNSDQQNVHERAEEAWLHGQCRDAMLLLEEAERGISVPRGTHHRDRAVLLITKADYLGNMGRPLAAMSVLKDATIEFSLDREPPRLLRVRLLTALASANIALGSYTNAQMQVREALSLFPADSTEARLSRVPISQLDAVFHLVTGDAKQADEIVDAATELMSEGSEKDSYLYGTTLALSGAVALYRDRPRSAVARFQTGITVLEQATRRDHPLVLHALIGLVAAKRWVGEHMEAWDLTARIRRACRETIDMDSTYEALCLQYQAAILLEFGELAEAQARAKEAVRMSEEVSGERSGALIGGLTVLGQVYQRMGKAQKAFAAFDRALRATRAADGVFSLRIASVQASLGGLALDIGDNQLALGWFTNTLEILGSVSQTNNLLVGNVFSGSGVALLRLGDYRHAMGAFETSLRIKTAVLGRSHPGIGGVLNGMGMALGASGDYEEAISCLQVATELMLKAYGPDHPDALTVVANLALAACRLGQHSTGLDLYRAMFRNRRKFLLKESLGLDSGDALCMSEDSYCGSEILHSHCAVALASGYQQAATIGAEQLLLMKSLVEEAQVALAAMNADSDDDLRTSRTTYWLLRREWEELAGQQSTGDVQERRQRSVQEQLRKIESHLAERFAPEMRRLRKAEFNHEDLARSLAGSSALLDVIRFQRYDVLCAKTDCWKEQRYAAYLTFPLAKDSTNVVVERVDMGEAGPIDEAVGTICRRMSAGQFEAKDLSAALQRASELVYAPLARHLTNVSHLIICPDGQLSRLPFEMLSHNGRFLIEEKTISYVTSGREIVRLAEKEGRKPTVESRGAKDEGPGAEDEGRESRVESRAAMVMGNPDFDLDVGSARGPRAVVGGPPATNRASPDSLSNLLAEIPLPQPASLSRSYRGIHFTPLPGAEAEARSVAALLGGDTVLRLGADAREAALKAVVSPRVLHLCTHGFFLSDQEFKRTNSMRDSWLAGGLMVGGDFTARRRLVPPENDWENPMVRCGLALAGANHAQQVTNALAEDGLLTGLEAALLNLQGTELVILSGCDSGTGEVKIGEGMMSLRRAFRIAGAQTVLASHWKVNDQATGRLMTEFIRRWRAGEPRARAWREAQLSLLRSKEFANPFFWAAFTLTGQWR